MNEADNQTSHTNPPDNNKPGARADHNIDDINVWGIVKFAIGLLIIGIVAYIGLYGLLRLFEHQQQASERPTPLMARGAEDRLPPPPRLQMMPGSPSQFKTPDYEMKGMIDEEEKTLNSYGWVNKENGVVRIPIDQAMKLVLQKGLQTRPSPGPEATPSPAPEPPAPKAVPATAR